MKSFGLVEGESGLSGSVKFSSCCFEVLREAPLRIEGGKTELQGSSLPGLLTSSAALVC